ncbi:MAG TPA: SAM-dependent methyltransferase [Bacteroidales bacterium]|nr:SAM-dependent methyltransferase [Bacteroidales bacterium]
MKGTLFLLPVTLGNPEHSQTIPAKVIDITRSIRLFAVENIRSARRFLRSIDKQFPIDDAHFFEIGKHSRPEDLKEFFRMILDGTDAGVMSEAGMPGLADPGYIVVAEAHKRGIRVAPLAGPSSIIMSLIASGFNGQSFAFNGYLPKDTAGRQKALKALEQRSAGGQTQIFMETPFRTDKVLNDILTVCKPSSRLCIAADLTLEMESVRTMTVAEWRSERPALDNRLVVFLLMA